MPGLLLQFRTLWGSFSSPVRCQWQLLKLASHIGSRYAQHAASAPVSRGQACLCVCCATTSPDRRTWQVLGAAHRQAVETFFGRPDLPLCSISDIVAQHLYVVVSWLEVSIEPFYGSPSTATAEQLRLTKLQGLFAARQLLYACPLASMQEVIMRIPNMGMPRASFEGYMVQLQQVGLICRIYRCCSVDPTWA